MSMEAFTKCMVELETLRFTLPRREDFNYAAEGELESIYRRHDIFFRRWVD
jgi:hypothetical protein